MDATVEASTATFSVRPHVLVVWCKALTAEDEVFAPTSTVAVQENPFTRQPCARAPGTVTTPELAAA